MLLCNASWYAALSDSREGRNIAYTQPDVALRTIIAWGSTVVAADCLTFVVGAVFYLKWLGLKEHDRQIM